MRTLRYTGIAALGALVIVGIGSAQEKRMKRSDLPPAVESTVDEVSRGATIKGFSQETENGITSYEVKMLVSGDTKEVESNLSGAVKEIEEQVSMDSLSAHVAGGLNAKVAGGKIRKVESITKNGKLVAYEAKIQDASGQKSEMQVGPNGKPLDDEE